MTDILVQRDPTTGLAMRDESTGLAMSNAEDVVHPYFWCPAFAGDNTPETFGVEFSGVGEGCIRYGTECNTRGNFSHTVSGLSSALRAGLGDYAWTLQNKAVIQTGGTCEWGGRYDMPGAVSYYWMDQYDSGWNCWANWHCDMDWPYPAWPPCRQVSDCLDLLITVQLHANYCTIHIWAGAYFAVELPCKVVRFSWYFSNESRIDKPPATCLVSDFNGTYTNQYQAPTDIVGAFAPYYENVLVNLTAGPAMLRP